MKLKIYIPALAVAMGALSTSCDLEVESQSSLERSDVFEDLTLADAAVMATHNSFSETNSYRGRFLPYYGLNTDIEWINGCTTTKPKEDKYMLCWYDPQASSTQMNTANNAWAKLYEAIERLNNCIVGLRASSHIGESDFQQLLGESLTLRAFIYLDLVKAWGDVPARFEPITDETQYLPRSSRDVIYEQILADLEEAEDLVAWPNGNDYTTTVERVSKSFVKGLRARVALYAGGYSQRKDGVRLSNNFDRTEMYQIALQECKDVIEAGYNSLGEFEDNFKNLCQDNVNAGGESLFELPFSDGRGRVLYTYGIKHQSEDLYTKQAQGGVNGPVPTLYYNYDPDDVRRDITCVPYEWKSVSNDATKAEQDLLSAKKWCFGKLRYEWMTRRVTSTNDDGVNWQVMRMADIYLMAAEAANELGDISTAWTYMKPVLDRALPADKVSELQAKYTASKDAFFEGIVDQRAFEFAGEMLRKADLIRWNLLTEKLTEAKSDLDDLRKLTGDYAVLDNDNGKNKVYFTTDTATVTTLAGNSGTSITLVIRGLSPDDQDSDELSALGYSSTTWLDPSSSDMKIPDDYVDAIFQNDPDSYEYWPIWQNFISSSNGTLANQADNLPEFVE